ncbi:hypothetical protein ACSSS7_005573 [Eimeria intestinalis]
MVQPASDAPEAPPQKAALMERMWRCALEDENRMDGLITYFYGAEACGRVYIQHLEQLREALRLPPPHVLCPDPMRVYELWRSLHAARNCMLILQMQIAFAKTHMARLRGEYGAVYSGLANTMRCSTPVSSTGSGNEEGGWSGNKRVDADAVTGDQLGLQAISDLLVVKEKEQAAWKPDGMHTDWGSALLGGPTVVFPQALGEIIPLWLGPSAEPHGHAPFFTPVLFQ